MNCRSVTEGISEERNKVNQKSLRHSNDSEEKLDNPLNTTPEFRNFVGKKLSQFLDSCIENIEKTTCEARDLNKKPTDSENSFKFFTFSKGEIRTNSEEKKTPSKRPVSNHDTSGSDSDSSENERLSEAAISHEAIFKSHGEKDCSNSVNEDNSKDREQRESQHMKERKHKNKKKKKKIKAELADDVNTDANK